jgi:hypothetical protein
MHEQLFLEIIKLKTELITVCNSISAQSIKTRSQPNSSVLTHAGPRPKTRRLHRGSIGPSARQSLSTPRPGRNLGLGRESAHPPRPILVQLAARSISSVHYDRTAARGDRGNKIPSRRPSLNPSSFLFFLPVLLACAPFHREQQRSAHGGQREEVAPPRAPSPELVLPLLVERSSVERPRVGALGPRHGGDALCHVRGHGLIPHGGGEAFGEASR